MLPSKPGGACPRDCRHRSMIWPRAVGASISFLVVLLPIIKTLSANWFDFDFRSMFRLILSSLAQISLYGFVGDKPPGLAGSLVDVGCVILEIVGQEEFPEHLTSRGCHPAIDGQTLAASHGQLSTGEVGFIVENWFFRDIQLIYQLRVLDGRQRGPGAKAVKNQGFFIRIQAAADQHLPDCLFIPGIQPPPCLTMFIL